MIPFLYALRREANALFDAEGFPNGKPFLRRAAEDTWLLVSDAPQRLLKPERAKAALEHAGLLFAGEDKLWYLDAPFAWYAQLAKALPQAAPQRPEKDAYLPAWHLCRTLLQHPAPIEMQPLTTVRKVLKAMEAGEKAILDLSLSLPPYLAALLREKKPLPALAGGLLAFWLNEQP